MRIGRISVYQVDLPYVDGSYNWAKGKSVTIADSTVVRIDTDSDVYGVGEMCPLPAYLPSYAGGVRAGLAELGPQLIGLDPTRVGDINTVMDARLRGHNYVKSAVDIACWDVLGKVTNLPLHTLLGGRQMDAMPMYRAVSQDTPEAMVEAIRRYRERGYRQFQLKSGGYAADEIERIRAVVDASLPGELVIADANTGWRRDEALQVAAATRNLDYYIEQPCERYEDCVAVARHASQPVKLDESIQSVRDILRAHHDDALDVTSIKISKFGDLSKARLARDVCISIGVPMTVEDVWGGDITTAALAHLAVSTPPKFLMNTTDLNKYVTVSNADNAPVSENGYLRVSDAPGLGIEPKNDVLRNPLAVYE
ncbi:MAG: mandelate racemase/muconate lactonizing enzyme family protein [Acidiferrobacterales bacterium]